MTYLDDGVLRHLRSVVDLPDLSATRYEVIREIGRGGMGTVYLARDRDLDRDVALKVLNAPDPTGDLRRRLVAEARHLARLEHPGIVPVHDVGQLPDERVFYVMRHVKGVRLDAWRRRASGLTHVLRVFRSLCEVVAFAHAEGVIHRDLKPENILVGPFGEVLVLDWGVAKRLRGQAAEDDPRPPRAPAVTTRDEPSATVDVGRTLPGSIIGTPTWMAPEQARGETASLDERTDVYGLGAILYFLLAGRAPFDDATSREMILERVMREEPVPLRQIDRIIPKPLAAICAKAMARARDARYASVTELASDVDMYQEGRPVTAHREGPIGAASRVLSRYRAVVLMILAYLVMRAVMLLI